MDGLKNKERKRNNMESDGKCIYEYYDGKCEGCECAKCPHYKPDYKKETKMKEEINVKKLIEKFRDMANRETLLSSGNVSQQDLLTQIIGTIAVVAMEE